MADVVMYPVLVMPITNDAGRNIGGENALTTLSAGTGGRVFKPSDSAGVGSRVRGYSARAEDAISDRILSARMCRHPRIAFTH